jgi:hypothetical protein
MNGENREERGRREVGKLVHCLYLTGRVSLGIL